MMETKDLRRVANVLRGPGVHSVQGVDYMLIWASDKIDALRAENDGLIRLINNASDECNMAKRSRNRAEAESDRLWAVLNVLLDSIDFTSGNCRPNDMVAAVLDTRAIDNARDVLKKYKEARASEGE